MTDLTAIWVCDDCYFAHHYGAFEHEGKWYISGRDEPCEGGEPLSRLDDGDDVSDWTCSDHDNTVVVCLSCDGEGEGTWRSERHLAEPPVHECDLCEGSGLLDLACPDCGSRDDENGLTEFTWRSCHGCDSHLGGSRYRLAIRERAAA